MGIPSIRDLRRWFWVQRKGLYVINVANPVTLRGSVHRQVDEDVAEDMEVVLHVADMGVKHVGAPMRLPMCWQSRVLRFLLTLTMF